MTDREPGSSATATRDADDDFWEWFDAPVETPERPHRQHRRRASGPARPLARRVVGAAAWSVVIAAFLLIGLLVLPTLAGMKVLSVRSGSMSPAIDPGDAVLVRPVLSADLHEGEIVTYRPPDNPSNLVTHRIVGIRYEAGAAGGYGDYIVTTKGDHNAAEDRPWRAAPNDVFGRVLVTMPKMGYILDFVSGPRGKVLAVLAFVAFLVAGSISRRRARDETEPAEE